MNKGYKTAWIYFVIHLLVEIVCFQIVFAYFRDVPLGWLMAFTYDFLAFVPQSLFGVIMDKYKRLNLGLVGAILMFMSTIIIAMRVPSIKIWSLILVSLGNAIIHAAGAIATTTVSEGKLSHSAIFVGGGSFGVIIGQTLGGQHASIIIAMILCVVIAFLIQITNRDWLIEDRKIPNFNLAKENVNPWIVILVAFLVVTVRSYIGYAIPISWKKELWQSFLLFFVMGFGKVMGGILSDKFGAKNVGVFSTLACIPFLLIGNNNMLISIVGVFMFSLTMSISFGTLLSVIKNSPGLAFGVTTIGLFLGITPMFFISVSTAMNVVLIITLSIACAIGMYKTLN